MSHYVVYHDGTLPRQLGNKGPLESACFRLTPSFLEYPGMPCPIRGLVPWDVRASGNFFVGSIVMDDGTDIREKSSPGGGICQKITTKNDVESPKRTYCPIWVTFVCSRLLGLCAESFLKFCQKARTHHTNFVKNDPP